MHLRCHMNKLRPLGFIFLYLPAVTHSHTLYKGRGAMCDIAGLPCSSCGQQRHSLVELGANRKFALRPLAES